MVEYNKRISEWAPLGLNCVCVWEGGQGSFLSQVQNIPEGINQISTAGTTRTRIRIRICIRTRAHTHTHTHIQTHIHTLNIAMNSIVNWKDWGLTLIYIA